METSSDPEIQKRYDIPAIIVAVLIGSFAIWLAERRYGGEGQAIREIEVPILVAAADIPAGQAIRAVSIEERPYPVRALSPDMARPEDRIALVDLPVKIDVKAGSPIYRSYVSGVPLDTRLSAKLRAGERALTIPVDPVSGLAGHLEPNDRVDIVATFRIPGSWAGESVRTRTLLSGVTVLAVGARTGSDFDDHAVAGRGLMSNSRNSPRERSASTVTLQVTGAQAELLVFASETATLQLTLRNADDLEPEPEGHDLVLSRLFELRPAVSEQKSKPSEPIVYDR